MSQLHWSVSGKALVVLRAAHTVIGSVCVSPLRQSQLTVITVMHNNGSGCSAGGQRSHCAIRPSQALADMCSQSSVALDKLARKKETKLWLSDHFRKDKLGQLRERSSRNKMTKMRKDSEAKWYESTNVRPVLRTLCWTHWNATPEGISTQLRFNMAASVAKAVVVLWGEHIENDKRQASLMTTALWGFLLDLFYS